MVETQEQDFIALLQQSNTQQQAFKQLVQQYQERLYWHIRRMVLNHNDADDVLQNTFIKVFKSIGKFKGESKLYTWMYRIATNEAITFLNSKAQKKGVSTSEIKEQMISNLEADVYFDGGEIQIKLQKAIASLPDKQQLVFNMKYFQDLKYGEMSEILETSVGALKASYHIASKKIEQFLTNE